MTERPDTRTLAERLAQSASDRQEVKIRLIDNAVLVKAGAGWCSFPSFDAATNYIRQRIDDMRSA